MGETEEIYMEVCLMRRIIPGREERKRIGTYKSGILL